MVDTPAIFGKIVDRLMLGIAFDVVSYSLQTVFLEGNHFFSAPVLI